MDTEYEPGKDIVGVSYGQGGEVLAALIAIGQSKRTRFATTGTFLDLVFGLIAQSCFGVGVQLRRVHKLVDGTSKSRCCLFTALVDVRESGGFSQSKL